MKTGNICYFKKVRNTAQKPFNEATFKGVGVGIMLGHIHPKDKDMDTKEAEAILNNIGWVSLGDVQKILGKKNYSKFIDKMMQEEG